MNVEEISQKAIDNVLLFTPKVLLAILALVIGFWIIKYIVNYASNRLQKSGTDVTLTNFFSSLVSILLKVMLVLSVASTFGINTTSFVAIFSALMLGIGMALNGTLGHAAAGVMLIIFRPFRVGHLVKIGGNQSLGRVESINAFNTTLKTLDNQRIIIGNSNITENDITNISGQGDVGVELTFGIGYGDDIDKARKVILEVGKKCPYILSEPVQNVFVSNLGDSSVDLATRPFCKSEHYWDVMFYMQENVKKAFDANGVGIPYPTMDLNVSNVV